MAYNHGKEDRKWQLCKVAEEKVLRQCGVDESTIEQIHIDDRAIFNSDRRFYTHSQEACTYLDEVAESEQHTEINTVGDLLNDIENEELFKALQTVDKLNLQIALLKIQGYSTKEIAVIVDLTPKSVYRRLDRLRDKLKHFKR